MINVIIYSHFTEYKDEDKETLYVSFCGLNRGFLFFEIRY